ncbi:zinc finger 142 [Pelobates cultripes]|uniref:Zinc finger protein 142 n=1 Tax=Pelobates cultripes TaxID=61616 RepID=A0AAD1WGW1_PELCU|nr:zinc finger 142 [Pelobates cultripes]
MADEGLEGSCVWTTKSCDQLLLIQTAPDCGYHTEHTAQNDALEQNGNVHIRCLDVDLSSHVKQLALDAPGHDLFKKPSEVEYNDPGDVCLLSQDLLTDTITSEPPNYSPRKGNRSQSRNVASSTERILQIGRCHQSRQENLMCPICHHEYKSPSELKEHFKSHTSPHTDFNCWVISCPFTTHNRKNFQAHLKQEHQLTPFTCSQRTCKLLFPSHDEMLLHSRNHFPFHCKRCDFVSSNVKIFTQHHKTHPRDEETQSGIETLESMLNSSDPAENLAQNMIQTDTGASQGSVAVERPKKQRKSAVLSGQVAGSHSDGERESARTVKKKATKSKTAVSAKTKEFKGHVEKGKEHLFKTHMCPECKRCFKKRTHLAEHLHLHFPDPNLQCPNCRKFFTSRSKLKIHMMRESGEKTHRCPLCDYSSVESNALNRHMASIHEGVSNFYSDTYSCPVCKETFKLSQSLKDHMKVHASQQKMLSCFQEGCNQALSDRKEFLRHLKEAHGIRGVECQYHACSLLFKSQEEMEQHRKIHYAFHCQECDFACSNKHAFRNHKKKGHPGKEELSCHFCPYKSFNPVEYADHIGKMHANEKIHRCGDCEFATAHKRVLIRHLLLHTGEKPHKCSLCDFTCRDISYLSKHMLTHSSEKNYMCSECGYITKWKHYLTVHMRKHSGDLRYQCNQCSYRCHRADQLNSHKLRHQGKSLICEVCGFGCKRKYELQKHMQTKHSQSCQTPMYHCQHCTYQTKYKQALLNHNNCKHTKQREFRCALCTYRTFSNTSLFFHKRKSHGYIPGDKDWQEKYATKQQEINQSDTLFPYKPEENSHNKQSLSIVQKLYSQSLTAQGQSDLMEQETECLQVGDLSETSGDGQVSVTTESLLATMTLEPVEACNIKMESFPAQLELSTSTDLLPNDSSVETLGACENSLPTKDAMLCFSETLAVEDNDNCGQEFEEEPNPQSIDQAKLGHCPTAQYNQQTMLCTLGDKYEELHVHAGTTLDLQTGEIPVEVQESWVEAIKGGVELTIVCESSGLLHNDATETEGSATSLEENSRPDSVLKALRKQDREQAEALVLEGRVQMLVVQSSAQVYKCEKCSYVTKKEESMYQHAKTACQVHRDSLVCKECGACFKQQRGLNTHIKKKCPVILKKKKAVLKTSSTSVGTDQQVSSSSLPQENSHGDDIINMVSALDTVQESQGMDISEHSLEDVETISSCQNLVQEEFKENIPEKCVLLDKGEIGVLFSPHLTGESHDNVSAQENGKYRYEQGKFHCLVCSFSCSRECTISCHVKENCKGLKRIICVQCPKVLLSEAALRKHQKEKHLKLVDQDKDQLSECSADDGSQNLEDVEENMEVLGNGNYKSNNDTESGCRLSCPTCSFKCSQDRAMRTHKKRGCLKPGELHCPLCSFRCMSVAALKRHRALHQKYTRNRIQLQCKQCDFICKQPRCMKQHVRIRHEGIKPHCCPYCDFSTTRRYRLDAHVSMHTGVGRISCSSCSRTFGTNSKLRLHQRRVHEKKPTHFCNLCDYSGYSQNDIARHMGSCHSGELAFPCSVCQASFSSEAALKQHSLRKHQEKDIHECPQCSFTCHSISTLRCHLQKHHLQLECSICKQSFSRRLDLEEHRKSHFAHHCQQCKYAAKDSKQLVHHYSMEHENVTNPGCEGEESFLHCPFCSFSCRHQLVYDHHVKGHGGTRLYKCTECDYTTRNKQKITWHSRIHTGEKPYKCHLCTYACADPSRLKYHMRIHMDEKKYLCPECGYKCKWVNQLKYHMSKHTGLKPYQCEECDYCTNRADALRVHRETRHQDIRSFICEQCGKAFKTRFLLKTHMKKHSEDKPYICKVCQSSFRWPAGLRHHCLTHTNQQPFFCQHCSYRAKQKFQVVKHIQRHHPDCPDISKGVGKDPILLNSPPQDPVDASIHQSTQTI